jgi:hypothetical protein
MERFIGVFPLQQNDEDIVEHDQAQDGFQRVVGLMEDFFEQETEVLPRLIVPEVPRPWGRGFLGVDARQHYRFTMDEIHIMAEHLQLPEFIVTENRYKVDRIEALCITLYRLSWPVRSCELEKLFPDRSSSALSAIFLHMVQWIHDNWKHLLLFDHVRLTPEFMERCVQAVDAKGTHQRNCWSFIDRTHYRICRPENDQREFYTGHKHMHSLKYQAISTPDGMIVHFGGPFPGRRHDARMLTDSHIRDYLAVHARNQNGDRLFVYGDEGYGRGIQVLAPFRGNVDAEQMAYNESMRRPRLAAEWGFCFISNNWGMLNFYTNLRIGLAPVGLYAPVAALFSNLLRCVGRGSTTEAYYQMRAPTIEEYLTPFDEWDQWRQVHAEPLYYNIEHVIQQEMDLVAEEENVQFDNEFVVIEQIEQ